MTKPSNHHQITEEETLPKLESKEDIEEYLLDAFKEGSVDEILDALNNISQVIKNNQEIIN